MRRPMRSASTSSAARWSALPERSACMRAPPSDSSSAALTALATAGADAVLSGHVHYPFDIPVERAGRTLRMIGAGTLSTRTRRSPPAFNELRVTGKSFETIARTFSPASDRVLAKGGGG